MTRFGKIGAAKGIVLGATLALAALASPASARWYGNGQWQEDNRSYDNHYYGYYYQAPPVVYGTPYNYGYQAPPVYYDNTPGISIRIF